LNDIADLKVESDADFRALYDGQTCFDARQNQEPGDRLVHGLFKVVLIGGGHSLHSEFVNRNIENASERCKEGQQENYTLKSVEQLAQLHGRVTFRSDTALKKARASRPVVHIGLSRRGAQYLSRKHSKVTASALLSGT
jgi:hypothetical protein